ncbi:hypothetical protein FGG79_11485 [Bacillus sp. BHET2]|uniref:hypothetical protein n=1 Tax=Bacillus sp. BHET2 TaxID=2583818 RepID=UPI00110DCD8E|nr:hypothetical protein [Bacillus sp. BHET2]TMU85816.1 hypothetical protein FGG79_11485 [Bacillus sp. BHET2]
MTTTFLIGTTLAVIYGGLSMISGAIELKTRNIPTSSAIVMILGAGGVLCSLYLIHLNTKYVLALIFCFLLMHITAIVNGYHLNGKINRGHHLIRFSISLVIFALLL